MVLEEGNQIRAVQIMAGAFVHPRRTPYIRQSSKQSGLRHFQRFQIRMKDIRRS